MSSKIKRISLEIRPDPNQLGGAFATHIHTETGVVLIVGHAVIKDSQIKLTVKACEYLPHAKGKKACRTKS
jgi:hypothetical protein